MLFIHEINLLDNYSIDQSITFLLTENTSIKIKLTSRNIFNIQRNSISTYDSAYLCFRFDVIIITIVNDCRTN